ncbi:MAG: hypothetical protein ACI8ZM_002785 [Crocinitomix sp.]|jgi:hypothetical protein
MAKKKVDPPYYDDLLSKPPIKPKCGIIMPISPIDGCSADHWKEVLSIISSVANEAGFESKLVSEADDIGIIQKTIIQNIYNNDIVICDVSGKNPNVMFELGMRLAFDKATVIIKDEKTSYTFDTGVIEHLGYPRDLRFSTIVEFKDNLKNKLMSTYKKSVDDPNYSTFLKNFGEYKIAKLNETEISTSDYMLKSIDSINQELRLLRRDFHHEIMLSSNQGDQINNFYKSNPNRKYSLIYPDSSDIIKIYSSLIEPMVKDYYKQVKKVFDNVDEQFDDFLDFCKKKELDKKFKEVKVQYIKEIFDETFRINYDLDQMS